MAILQGDECQDAEKKILASTVQSITEQNGNKKNIELIFQAYVNFINNNNNNDANYFILMIDQVEIVNAMQSCKGRCSDNQKINTWTTIIPLTSPDICQCTIDCADDSTCCPDFSEYCVLGNFIITT